jgi:hypothetical protein
MDKIVKIAHRYKEFVAALHWFYKACLSSLYMLKPVLFISNDGVPLNQNIYIYEWLNDKERAGNWY